MVGVDRQEEEATLLYKLQRVEEAHKVYQSVLRANPDQWSCWQGLLSCSLPDSPTTTSPLLLQTHALIDELHTKHPLDRGPALASLELLRRVIEKGGDVRVLPDFLGGGKPVERLRVEVEEYVAKYGTKLCCFDDLVPYLGILVRQGGEELMGLVQAVTGRVEATALGELTEDELKALPKVEVVNRLRAFTLSQQLLRYLGACEEQQLDALCQVYFRTLFVNDGAEGGQREVQLGDDLVLLAGHVLRDLGKKAEMAGEDDIALRRRLELACLIEQCHKHSPYNYHFKILLKQVMTPFCHVMAPPMPLSLFLKVA